MKHVTSTFTGRVLYLCLPVLLLMLVVTALVVTRDYLIVAAHQQLGDRRESVSEDVVFAPFYLRQEWAFYSSPVFNALSGVGVDAQGNTRVDADLRRALKHAVAKLPPAMQQQQLQRLQLLIEKQYPGAKGQQLAHWVVTYHRYREAKRAFLAASSGEDRVEVFRQLMVLRESFFGSAQARLLFEHQYRFAKNLASLEG